MPPTPPAPAKIAPRRPSAVLIGIGVLVVAIGFGVPQFLGSTPSETPAASEQPTPDDARPIGPSLVRLAVGLVVVCGLCIGATRLLNRRNAVAAGPMQAVASFRLNGRCAVHLVEAGGRRLLVGTDAAGVKALVELPAAPPAIGEEPDVVPFEPVASAA
jgi:flagellar biogenesis protein FliO